MPPEPFAGGAQEQQGVPHGAGGVGLEVGELLDGEQPAPLEESGLDGSRDDCGGGAGSQGEVEHRPRPLAALGLVRPNGPRR